MLTSAILSGEKLTQGKVEKEARMTQESPSDKTKCSRCSVLPLALLPRDFHLLESTVRSFRTPHRNGLITSQPTGSLWECFPGSQPTPGLLMVGLRLSKSSVNVYQVRFLPTKPSAIWAAFPATASLVFVSTHSAKSLWSLCPSNLHKF